MRGVGRGFGAALLLGTMVMTACGTRTEPAADIAPVPMTVSRSPSAPLNGSGLGGVRDSSASTDSVLADRASRAQTGGEAKTRAPVIPGRATQTTAAASAGSPAPNRPAGAAAAPEDHRVIPAPAPPISPPAGPAKEGTPITVASVGTYTGPIGAAIVPGLSGAQLWVKYMNDRGGVNGRKIAYLIFDDGGDPARHLAQVREAVEQKGAIAFLQNGEALTGRASLDYINTKRVPVIGSDGLEPWAETSPMYFPVAATGSALNRIFAPSIAQIAIPHGRTKLGIVVCAETPSCDETAGVIAEDAPKRGLTVAYRARMSVAQPDYTAECLAARNNGVNILFIAIDGSGYRRFVLSCARQGYRPSLAMVAAATDTSHSLDPNFDGAMTASTVFPYFQDGTPATDEYQVAAKRYGGGRFAQGNGPALGWTAGKLLERAAAQLPEVTSRSLLARLWTVKADNLGGLTYPLTFVAEKPNPSQACWFLQTVEEKRWTSPDGFQVHCV